ncbi:MAG: hypothetical protein HC908_11565 [Calothrix sp. SM1_7_51]|nr:hypothetical protein [Calothrix sp. SM1_7_51]
MIFDKRSQVILLTTLTLPATFALVSLPSDAAKPTLANKYQPLPNQACINLQQNMARAIKKRTFEEVTLKTPVNFEDLIAKAKGGACELTATSNGKQFKTLGDIAIAMMTMLRKQGWLEDQQYAANSPEGMLIAFRKDKDLLILSIESKLAKEVKCDQQAPIASCYERAKPEQIFYSISLKAARGK